MGLAFGAVLLEAGQAGRAATVLDPIARAHDVPDAWIALAACRLALGEEAPCLEALERALQSRVVDRPLADLASRIVERFGRAGWCGIGAGRVRFGPGRPGRMLLDGTPLRGTALPEGFRGAHRLEVEGSVGSPLPIRRFSALTGLVELDHGGLTGWAWHPADPERDPVILLRGPSSTITLTASAPADGVPSLPPLARPRRFGLTAEQVRTIGQSIAVTDQDGRPLLGSPLLPLPLAGEGRGEGGRRSKTAASALWPHPHPTRSRERERASDAQCAVVIPVHGRAAETLDCLRAVLATVPPSAAIYVVDDASDDRALAEALQAMHNQGRIHLLRHARTLGYPAAANAGIRAAGDRDVVLLNSDTVVPPGWLERLRHAAYAGPAIGSVTPLSNEATIVSYPDPEGGNDPHAGADAIAQRVNAGLTAEVPVGVGFCLYLRRDCLDQVGLFREDLFAQGYGEENDLCMRAREAGWRHVAALDVVVMHLGGRSFGAGGAALRRRNGAILNRLHPGYDALIAEHIAADPLLPARRRMDALRWVAGRSQAASVVLVTHGEGGGVAELVASRCDQARVQGLRPIVLRPDGEGCRIEGFPNLRYRIPSELGALAALLRPDRPTHLEVHHLLGHAHGILELAGLLGIPVDTWVHDDAAFCPRIALVGGARRYCGEPELEGCEHCIADYGSKLPEPIGVRDLVARSAAELAASRRVIVPVQDAARRLRRHFPQSRPEVLPWEDDGALPPLGPAADRARALVCVVGGIGVEKGYDVLLACVHDAARRALPLDFVVCGHTEDDSRLLAAGPVFVIGPYRPDEAVALIRAQAADIAFLPSIWPEVWCYALSRAWQAGLRAVAFDLGAQAERIRATGRGAVLPLGLPVPALNDALLRLARVRSARQSSQP